MLRSLWRNIHHRIVVIIAFCELADVLSRGHRELLLFGLRREVLEGAAIEPEELLSGLDAVTADDIQRVAQDVIGSHGLNLALVGPFDDEERFAKLLA